MKRADSLLSPIIRNLGIEEGVRLAQIRRDWYILFQKPLSYHMSPSLLSKGELLLNIDSPVWLQELKFYTADILKKLDPYGVKAIRFRLGRVSLTDKAGSINKKPEDKHLKAEERSYIEKTVSQIHDEALKVTVKQAMERAITSGKTKIR